MKARWISGSHDWAADDSASPMQGVRFTAESDRVIYHSSMDDIRKCLAEGKEPPSMEVAGPREQIFHDPENLACGIVTCGGLCPGLNDVIRSIVLKSLSSLWCPQSVRVSLWI